MFANYMVIELVTLLVILNICYENKFMAPQKRKKRKSNNVPNIWTKYMLSFYLIFGNCYLPNIYLIYVFIYLIFSNKFYYIW